MLSSDQDPLTSTWHCKLPVRVWLAPNSISSPSALHPFYLLVPRQSYVTSISTQIWPQVQHVLPKLPGNVQPRPWFDFNGVPLKSTLPVGVLHDLLAPGAGEGGAAALPWHLNLHYTHAPPEASVSWLATLPPQTLFMNSLKEACHICKGADGSAAVMRMEGVAQDALWTAVEKCDVTQYLSSLASLKVVPSPRSQGAFAAAIPVRVLLREPSPQQQPGDSSSSSAPPDANVWDSTVCTSRPILAVTSSGAWTTLGDLLHAMLPMLFPQPTPLAPISADVPLGDGTDAGAAAVAALADLSLAEVQAPTDQSAGGDQNHQPQQQQQSGVAGQGKEGDGGGGDAQQSQLDGSSGAEQEGREPLTTPRPAQDASGPSGEGAAPSVPGQDAMQGRSPAAAAAADDPMAASMVLSSPPRQGAELSGPSDSNLEVRSELSQVAAAGPQAVPLQLTIPLTTRLTLPAPGTLPPAPATGTDAGAAASAGEAGEQQQQQGACAADDDGVQGVQGPGVKAVAPPCQWRVCGVQPPLDTPVAWLHAHMHAPDYFLYVVVRADAGPRT